MDHIPISLLFGALALLIILSGFFSGSETGLMTLNRYRLKHLSRAGHRGAQRADRLLQRPDRLIGLILLGNNFVNNMAAAVITVIGLRLLGEASLAIAIYTVFMLIFAEVAPKTLAALHPERIAFPAAYVLGPMLRVFYPLVRVINSVANFVLKIFGVSMDDQGANTLSSEELRTVVNEAGAMIPRRHQKMLISILDLEKVTVEDIMVPRNEIVGIDIDGDWDAVNAQLNNNQHTRLPVYRESIDHVIGFLHMRSALEMVMHKDFSRDSLLKIIREPYFVPENTPLNKQLLNFQREKRRIAMVVDEYGDIMGLVTLEDILEEIVGEFTSDPAASFKDVLPQADGSYLVDGSANIREINRLLGWKLPTDGPKTLNGLILEYLETIPESGTSLLLSGHPVEIMQVKENAVKTARIMPSITPGPQTPDQPPA